MKKLFYILLITVFISTLFAQNPNSGVKLGRVKYSGGGDWYNDRSSEVNLLKFIGTNTNIPVNPVYEFVDLKSSDIFNYPILFLTGHGNINLTKTEIENLRKYLELGGFLYVDDDYGIDTYIRETMKEVLPENEFKEVPFNHGIYHIHYEFTDGPPKIHEHDDKAPRGYGIFLNGRLCVYYTVESNPSDGWADPEVHNDSPELRTESLKFGTNIIVWALTN